MSLADASKRVRNHLLKAFPDCAFRVRANNRRSVITCEWHHGPDVASVRAALFFVDVCVELHRRAEQLEFRFAGIEPRRR